MSLGPRVRQRIKKRLDDLRGEIERVILSQVPQPGKNPYATGALKSSVTVKVGTKGGNFSLNVGYFAYGVYTNLGTGKYNTVKFGTKNSSPFRLPGYEGYRRGSFGIQPQYWTSMGGQARANRLRDELLADMKDEVRLYFRTIKKKK